MSASQNLDIDYSVYTPEELTYFLESLNSWQLEMFENIYQAQKNNIEELNYQITLNNESSSEECKPNSIETSRLSQFLQSFEREKEQRTHMLRSVLKQVTDSSHGMERAYTQHTGLHSEVIETINKLRTVIENIGGEINQKDETIDKLSTLAGTNSIGIRLPPKLLNVLLEPWQCQVVNGAFGVNHDDDYHKNTCISWLPALRSLGLSALKWDPDIHNETVLIEFREMPHLEALILNMILKLPDWKHSIVCGPKNVEMIRSFNIEGLNILEWKNNVTRVSEYSEMLRRNRNFWRMFTGNRILLYQEDAWLFNTKGVIPALEYEYCGAPWPISFKLSPNGVGNGGLSIRCPKSMIECCGTRADQFPDWIATPNIRSHWPRKENGNWIVPEDVHFCNVKAKFLNIAPFEVARHFALDSYWTTDDYSGGHKWWQSKRGRTNYFTQIRVLDDYWLQSKYDHRCGWFCAIKQLFENSWLSFTMQGPKSKSEIKMITAIDCYEFHYPINEPWIGVLHAPYLSKDTFKYNPLLKAQCFNGGNHPMSSEAFGESLGLCKMLIVMCVDEVAHVEKWLEETWGFSPPVDVWTHPIADELTNPAVKQEKNKEYYKSDTISEWPIVQLGRQDRIFSEVYTLKTSRERQWINHLAEEKTIDMVEEEAERRELEILGKVEILSLTNDEFDIKLQESIMLIPLWAATANNSVLEIMSMNVPAFISRLPSTEFVLGAEYPMFYTDPKEIESVIDDNEKLAKLMNETRIYLQNMDKSKFTLDNFVESVAKTILRLDNE
jgi:hypothetical protein